MILVQHLILEHERFVIYSRLKTGLNIFLYNICFVSLIAQLKQYIVKVFGLLGLTLV